MAGIAWQDSPYEGRTSAVPWQRPYDSLDCRGCGSSLAGRREAVEKITTRGIVLVREIFRCKCGRGRWVERQEAAR